MKRFIFAAIVLLPISVLFACQGQVGGTQYTATDIGSVEGIVNDVTTGELLSGVTVSIGDNHNVTGDAGAYTISDIEVGDRTITAVKSGYQTYTGTVTVTKGTTVTQNISMTKNPPAIPPDTTAPTTPTGLLANAVSSTEIDLSWTASTDDTGVAGYEIYNGAAGSLLMSVTNTTANDTSLSAFTKYCYSVLAYDAAGNKSAKCAEQCATTLSATDTTAPTAPTGLVANAVSATEIDLSWTANIEGDLAGYEIYRGGTKIANTTATSYADTGLTNSTTYCYNATAYDAAGNESSLSSQVCTTTLAITIFHIPDTGQAGDYTTTFGEDSDYTINPMSFTDNGDGTVTDNITGLVWQKEDDDVTRTWADAETPCDNLALGGQTDWRLPSEMELMSIVDYGTFNPAINTAYFPNTNATHYWASTSYVSDPNYAWPVSFSSGFVDYTDGPKTNGNYVRCVRGDEQTKSYTDNGNGTIMDNNTGLMWQKEDDDMQRAWQDAVSYCEGSSLAGHTDWRLPNVKELRSIVDNSIHTPAPAIDTTYFPNTNATYYWSSTTYTDYTANAYVVVFWGGYVSVEDKGNAFSKFTRCVRGQ